MSSFRPDPQWSSLAFRAGMSGSPSAGGFRPDGGVGDRGPAPRVAPASACTSEQHAALEQAAFEKGRESAEVEWSRCEKACAVFEAAAAALDRASVRRLHENREAMIDLAAEIARHWIGEELRVDPTRFAGPLDRALALCAGAVQARICLHPEVIAALETSLPDWLARWSESLEVELMADPDLAPDAFRIETGTQSVDAGYATLGARLREVLASALATPAPEAAAC